VTVIIKLHASDTAGIFTPDTEIIVLTNNQHPRVPTQVIFIKPCHFVLYDWESSLKRTIKLYLESLKILKSFNTGKVRTMKNVGKN